MKIVNNPLLSRDIPLLPDDSGDGILPLPTNDDLINFLAYLQKWGVIVSFLLFTVMILLALIAKANKNPSLQRSFKFFAYGLAIIAVALAFLPYYVIYQVESTALPSSPTDESSHSTIAIILSYIKAWEVIICLYIIMIASLFAATAKIRNNLMLKRKYSFFAYGAALLGGILFFLPQLILNYLGNA
ncbi:hypothetical protein PV433_10880 [Paenibacillus sp. GYB004]|uniref:hypothetical protein n=1 Tax=Paenibacillus sp. GYB004 TaxID=2994393 RepID=UPI002F96B559